MENSVHITEFVRSKCLGLKVSKPVREKVARHLNGCKIFLRRKDDVL